MPQPQTQQTYPKPLIINRSADFVTVFTSIKIVLSLNISAGIAIRMDTRRDSTRAVNDSPIEAIEKVPIKLNISNASGDAVQLSRVMKYGTAFEGKTAATGFYVADRDINLIWLDWTDMFNVLEPKV
ncbi:hypothetical protein ACTXT7_002625 [Hymenolepis weldensis]